jgi:hypothetical protein
LFVGFSNLDSQILLIEIEDKREIYSETSFTNKFGVFFGSHRPEHFPDHFHPEIQIITPFENTDFERFRSGTNVSKIGN